MEVSSETGASTWLSSLPCQYVAEHDLALHKGAFHDALFLQDGRHPQQLLSQCAYNKHFTIEHALDCSRGGFPSIRYIEIGDINDDFNQFILLNYVQIEDHFGLQ